MDGYGTLSATLGPSDDDRLGISTSKTDLLEPKKPGHVKKKYPYGIFFILSNEFCERFSYYGMRAILVLYLTRWLGFGEDQATSIFHAFSMTCYLMPVFGAIIADGYIGRYKTILYLSIVYFFGSLTITLTSMPPPEWIGPAIGLLLIAMGTGGIKASVAPFGADQFTAGQEKEQESFFSAFYFMINLGSMISIVVTPILRADVSCFGQDCYILAFGVPAVLMFLSVLLFVAGNKIYRKIPPAGNVIGKTIKCIYHGALGRICRTSYDEKRSHWLYYSDDKYDPAFIEDVRQLLKVLYMFIPLPLFWALSDQQGSRWTLQAEHMDGNMGVFGMLKPDQMQALNPLMILVLIPLFDRVVYPLLDYCKIPNRPLQRMVVGLFITSFAFICAGLVQLKIDNAEEPSLSLQDTGLTFLNAVPCKVQIDSDLYKGTVQGLEMSDFLERSPNQYTISVTSKCPNALPSTYTALFTFDEDTSYRMIIYREGQQIKLKQFYDKRTKPKRGDAAVSVFSTVNFASSSLLMVKSNYHQLVTDGVGVAFNATAFEASEFMEMEPGGYTLHIPSANLDQWTNTAVKLTFGTGGVYTVLIQGTENEPDVTVFVDIEKNAVSIAWLIPQYFLITLGEVLFSVSGLSFAYSQAPDSLKSVVQAIWLLTVSFGDLVVIIVANIQAIPSQFYEFILFACLMFINTVIFMIMSLFYKYKKNSLYQELLEEDDKEVSIPATEPITVKLGEDYPLQTRN